MSPGSDGEFFASLTGAELDAWERVDLLLDTHNFMWVVPAANDFRRQLPT